MIKKDKNKTKQSKIQSKNTDSKDGNLKSPLFPFNMKEKFLKIKKTVWRE